MWEPTEAERRQAEENLRKFEPTSKSITITFNTIEQARAFKSWFCHSGEQYYWECVSESPYAFDYHNPGQNVIRARADESSSQD